MLLEITSPDILWWKPRSIILRLIHLPLRFFNLTVLFYRTSIAYSHTVPGLGNENNYYWGGGTTLVEWNNKTTLSLFAYIRTPDDGRNLFEWCPISQSTIPPHYPTVVYRRASTIFPAIIFRTIPVDDGWSRRVIFDAHSIITVVIWRRWCSISWYFQGRLVMLCMEGALVFWAVAVVMENQGPLYCLFVLWIVWSCDV